MIESDEEQLEVLKNWWKENGTSLLVAVALGFFGIFGYKAWETNLKNSGEAAASIYEELLASREMDAEQYNETMIELDSRLKNEYPESIYAVLSSLAIAKELVDGNDLGGAKNELKWALDRESDESLQTLVKIRLARVLVSDGEPEEAFQLLENSKPEPGQISIYEETMGDIFLALGNSASARQSYQRAIIKATEGQPPALLELKLADIPYDAEAVEQPVLTEDNPEGGQE